MVRYKKFSFLNSIPIKAGIHLTFEFSIAETASQVEALRAAGIGLGENDPTEPVLTLRMWILGIVFCIVVSGLNTLYTLRTPSITISASVVLLLAYPVGKLWGKIIPDWRVPLGCWSFSLNPGPFNTKVSHKIQNTNIRFAFLKANALLSRIGTRFDLHHVEPQCIRSPRGRRADRTTSLLWL